MCLALKEVTNLIQVLCPSSSTDLKVPMTYLSLNGNYPDNPFMWDYLAAYRVCRDADIALFEGAPYSITVRALKNAKIIVHIAAHNLEKSVEEFHRLGMEYPFRHMTDPFLWSLYSDFIKRADLIITPSQMGANYIKRNPGVSCPIEVIPYGADTPKEVKPVPEEFKVGYLGAVGPDKGVIYLLKAWAGLMYKDARLLIAGSNQLPFEELLYRTNYTKLGYVENISDFYNSCSVYVQPSVTEGFGIPCLEAMAQARPVIVSEGAGVSELVEDGVEGFVVPVRDAGAIADRIDWFKRNPSKVEEMGQKARLKAEQYPWSKARELYERTIQSLS